LDVYKRERDGLPTSTSPPYSSPMAPSVSELKTAEAVDNVTSNVANLKLTNTERADKVRILEHDIEQL